MRLEPFAGVIYGPSLILAGIQQIIKNLPNAYHEFSGATSVIRSKFSRLVRPIWLSFQPGRYSRLDWRFPLSPLLKAAAFGVLAASGAVPKGTDGRQRVK